MTVRRNSLRAWYLAARPKTLSAALIPVCTAAALAYSHGAVRWTPVVLCVLFAGLMQIAANFINDLFDFLKGTDGKDRLGPERACAQGWITPRAMKVGIGVVLTLAAACGLGLVAYGGWWLIGLGVLCMVFAFLYTTMLSYCGLGDLLVYVFFGFVPVLGTYYLATGTLAPDAWWLAVACGLLIDTLLVLNNYRDRDTDRAAGKCTLVVVLGETFGSVFYLLQGIGAYLCVAMLINHGHWLAAVLPAFYLISHFRTWRKMVKINKGRELNRMLGFTSANMLFFATLTILALVLEPYL